MDTSYKHQHCGWSSTSIDNELIKEDVVANFLQTMRELGTHINNSIITVYRHMKSMGKVKKIQYVCSAWAYWTSTVETSIFFLFLHVKLHFKTGTSF